MTIWGAFDCGTQQYYEDDGGGSRSYETLLDADTDVDALRSRVNAYFAQPKIIDFYRNNKYVIPADGLSSAAGHGSGGGCYSTHTIVLKALPRLEIK